MEGEDGFLKWQPSVEKNPWIYKGQITPIYEVVKDETIKKELRIATQAHLDEAYLEASPMRKCLTTNVWYSGVDNPLSILQ